MNEAPELDPPAGALVTIFRSRLSATAGEEYAVPAAEMEGLARSMSGFIEFKGFAAPDGERLALVVFDSAEHQEAWRTHPAHQQAQRLGRERFYERFQILVTTLQSARRFTRAG